jgi:hypothetical protein
VMSQTSSLPLINYVCKEFGSTFAHVDFVDTFRLLMSRYETQVG